MELFTPFGEVVNCSLPLERDTGRKRGFAFVEMAEEDAEAAAIEALQGVEMMGRPLRINKAEPRGGGPRRSGGYGGGYGGGGYGGGADDARVSGGMGGGAGRGSGARGWEDRSYGSTDRGAADRGSDGFDSGRVRRRRTASGADE